MLAGFIVGCVLLLFIFLAIRFLSIVVPMAIFFSVTSVMLYYLAFVFAGKGIRELQEAEWIGSTPVDFIPTINLLGLYPTMEGVLLQGLLLVGLVVAIAYFILTKENTNKVYS